MSHTESPLSEDLLGSERECLVEILAIDRDKGLAEKFIDMDALSVALFEGILAYSPTMKIKGLATTGELGHADWVEPAGLRLAELAGALKEASLDGAEAIALLIESGVGTFLSLIHNGGHDVSITIN